MTAIGRLELEPPTLTLAESQFALATLATLAMLGDGQREAIELLRRLLKKTRTVPNGH